MDKTGHSGGHNSFIQFPLFSYALHLEWLNEERKQIHMYWCWKQAIQSSQTI